MQEAQRPATTGGRRAAAAAERKTPTAAEAVPAEGGAPGVGGDQATSEWSLSTGFTLLNKL